MKMTSPLIYGILNVTPDSFYDGGKAFGLKKAIAAAKQMVEDGADGIDVGGESTRPGAPPVPEDVELRRVLPVVRALAARFDIPISIDTRKPAVACAALEAGARMLNDISAFRHGKGEMARIAAQARVPVVIMHMRGTPQTMQANPRYHDVVADVKEFLLERAAFARGCGVHRSKIILDPGIGFGKTVRHNLELLGRLDELTAAGYPVMVGPSRKSFIGKILGGLPADERLEGTIGVCVWAAMHGVAYLRVHDVAAVKRAVRLAASIGGSCRHTTEVAA